MIRAILVCSVVLIIACISRADDSTAMPKGLPPLFGTAVASTNAVGMTDFTIELTVPQTRWQVTGDIVAKREWPKLQVAVKKDTRTMFFGGPAQLAESRVVDLQGKALSKAEILKRLKTEAPVLVNVDTQMIDPYYLRLIKPDTIVILLGPREDSPAVGLLPAAAPKR